MNVMGIAYISRRETIISSFGENLWKVFLEKLVQKDNFFSLQISQNMQIPLDKFLLFSDEVLKEFYNNDEHAYWIMGEKSAEHVLSERGVYRTFLLTDSFKQFVEVISPKIWSAYFDEGKVISKLDKNIVEVEIKDVPSKHIYFEYLIMGYVSKALQLFGNNIMHKKIKGFSSGDNEVKYQFTITKKE